MFDIRLKLGEVIDNEALMDIFKCGNMGGMRKSNKTNTLILISDYTKRFYNDKWIGDILHYTGMGKIGDQDINFMQNKTLNNSNRNGIEVFLFEVFEPKKYVFGGRVELAGEPYQENQKDDENNMRKVWIFPLKRIE